MASTILVKDVIWRIAVALQDTMPQFARWDERELVNWLNDGQATICRYLPFANARIDAIKLAPGNVQSIAAINPSSCKPSGGAVQATTVYGLQALRPLRNMGSDGITPGKIIRVVERDTLDSADPYWMSKTGNAVSAFLYDPQTPKNFLVSPGIPSIGNYWIELSYSAMPDSIPNTAAKGNEAYVYDAYSTQTITIDDEFMPDLVDYVVAQANLKDVTYAEPAKASFHWSRFATSLGTKFKAVTGSNLNLTVMPGVTEQGAKA